MTIFELYKLFCEHPTVTTDSRDCPVGSLFFALRGDTFDGNAYAQNALNAGCAYAVIDNPDFAADERMILVDNTLETLQSLALHHRKTLNTKIIAITGTNGKTTTKELVAAVLSRKYKTLYTHGNLNNHIGVPLTLLKLTAEHQIAVIEMGANHPGEIRTLVNIALPNCGLITNIGYAHLEGFGSIEGVQKTKGELFDYLRSTGGIAFLNSDDKRLRTIADGLETISYGIGVLGVDGNENPDIKGEIVDTEPYLSFGVKVCWKQVTFNTLTLITKPETLNIVSTRLVGAYNIHNVLAAVTAGLFFEVEQEQIITAISTYEPSNNRSQMKQTAHNTLIIDAYNANPSSMQASLSNFVALKAEKKAVILGDMLELGTESTVCHAEIMEIANKSSFDLTILCGKNFTAVSPPDSLCFETADSLAGYLKSNKLQHYTILIKGSHGIHLEKIIDLL
ncbi:MAG: UDP-N-acetylmuramoyl-tripeptide--D-alanyl-D-alanine ligase [Tannerella sp.]|jgi:UDP-N-acetylmuramoyl-tripeptide--D-alanyl-D-alanine ligase|nr:UDP-N-acetylmuramoyl-tripeptide--D-alanyl-D-alanine ligase [Tannerella sp.]